MGPHLPFAMTPPNAVLLAIDTCSPGAVIAAVDLDDGRIEGTVVDAPPNQTSEAMMDATASCLSAIGAPPRPVAAVAVAEGPGTFTGTRAGLAFAFGLCVGWDVPCVPISPLEALARASGIHGEVLACLDARKGEVYAAGFRVAADGAITATMDAVRAPYQAVADARPWAAIVGPGADAHAADLNDARIRRGVVTTPSAVAAAARAAFSASLARPPERVRAVYLRKSYAELGLNRPKRPAYRSPLLDDDSA
ncbi:MAG: tRNA (adenosine(37)-N6)-threonylcarbamoyltransferase complex dimerization subunit type 1 TsaB [Deltaproteobacteria bacterium]|nr:MAG: tRNA (adenosine(37)-N6)-threonylcarbamoyltransferase complex dimerization subunit type 1 TsaB [Deltaproteobacteria bacterium]